MKIRNTDGVVLIFPEGHEFRAFKLWLHEYGKHYNAYHDATAGCYVLKNLNIKHLQKAGFTLEVLTKKDFNTMVKDILVAGYPEEEA